jgi:hypothetical protein
LETKAQGIFPVSCTLPLSRTLLVLIAFTGKREEIMGHEFCLAARDSHPDYVSLYTFNHLEFNDNQLDMIMKQNKPEMYIKTFVCGPPQMNEEISDLLRRNSSKWNLDPEDIRVKLPRNC